MFTMYYWASVGIAIMYKCRVLPDNLFKREHMVWFVHMSVDGSRLHM